jgi:hypothetical protein
VNTVVEAEVDGKSGEAGMIREMAVVGVESGVPMMKDGRRWLTVVM